MPTWRGGPVPGMEFALTLVSGAGSTGRGSRDLYILAEYDAGTGSADGTAISDRFAGVNDAVAFFGTGSTGAWMCAHIFKEFPNARVYGVPVTPLGAGGQATGVFTWGGVPATAAGVAVINLGGTQVSLTIPVGMTLAQAAIALDLAIDNKKLVGGISDVPVVASNNGATTTTVTAHTHGLEWDQFPISVVSNTATGLTLAAGAAVLAGGGGLIETTLLPAGLALIDTVRTPLIVSQWNIDGADKPADLLLQHLITKNDKAVMLFSSGFMAKIATHTNLAIWAAAIDTADAQDLRLIGWNGSHNAPAAMAAAYAAEVAAEPDLNTDRNGVVMKTMIAPSSADAFTTTEEEICLEGGVAAGLATDGGKVAISRYLTARIDLTDDGAMSGCSMDVMYQVMLWCAEETTPLTPTNVVPDGYEAYGPNSITAEGIRAGFMAGLLKAEQAPYGWLYAVAENEGDMDVPTVTGDGKVTSFIPATLLRRVPAFLQNRAEFQHEVDGVA